MNRPSPRPFVALCLLATLVSLGTARAHTLPISYLTIVPDKDYLHVELVLNPFELNFFSEIDTNHNHRLDPAELAGPGKDLTRRLVNCLVVRVDGKVVRAETAGVVPDLDSHHITLRAHYRVDARRARVAIQSRLNGVTSGSHITQVRFGKPGHIQSAQLDQQSAAVTFKPFESHTTAGPEGVVSPPVRGLSQPAAARDRLKAALQTGGAAGSGSQRTVEGQRRLSKNRQNDRQVLGCTSPLALSGLVAAMAKRQWTAVQDAVVPAATRFGA